MNDVLSQHTITHVNRPESGVHMLAALFFIPVSMILILVKYFYLRKIAHFRLLD